MTRNTAIHPTSHANYSRYAKPTSAGNTRVDRYELGTVKLAVYYSYQTVIAVQVDNTAYATTARYSASIFKHQRYAMDSLPSDVTMLEDGQFRDKLRQIEGDYGFPYGQFSSGIQAK